jgi:hypothetical protein
LKPIPLRDRAINPFWHDLTGWPEAGGVDGNRRIRVLRLEQAPMLIVQRS